MHCIRCWGRAPNSGWQRNKAPPPAQQSSPSSPAESKKARSSEKTPENLGVAGHGMRIVKDPQTGRLRPPTRSEARRFTVPPGLNRSSEGLVETRRPDGAVMVDLQGRFRHSSVASKGPDGKTLVHCNSSNHEAHGHAVPGAVNESPQRLPER